MPDTVDQVFRWIHESELRHEKRGVSLVAGANVPSEMVRRAAASSIGGRPRLGALDHRLANDDEPADKIQELVEKSLCQLFNAAAAESRVLSGTLANLYVYVALCHQGDVILAPPKAVAGHASHSVEGAAGLYGLRIEQLPYVAGTHVLDWARLETALQLHRPRLIVVGSSLPTLPYDLRHLRTLADRFDSSIVYDAAHVAGIIAGGRFQDPLAEGADILTISTYKSFNGPPGGAVLFKDAALAVRVRQIAYPGLTANFDMARVAGSAVACLELCEFGREFADSCLANAQALAAELDKLGLAVWRADRVAYTKSHVFALDASEFESGPAAVDRASRCNLFMSPIPLPGVRAGGLRIGVHEVTRRGMVETDMPELARLVQRALRLPQQVASTRAEVAAFSERFQAMRFVLQEGRAINDS